MNLLSFYYDKVLITKQRAAYIYDWLLIIVENESDKKNA